MQPYLLPKIPCSYFIKIKKSDRKLLSEHYQYLLLYVLFRSNDHWQLESTL